MPWIAAIGAVGSAAIGAASSAAQRTAAQNALNTAMQQINAVGAPPDLAQQIVLQQFQQAGVLTPALEQTFQQGASQLNNYQNSQQTVQAQTQALAGLQARAAGGLTAEDRAAINQAQMQANQAIQSNRQNIIQSLQQRGQNTQGAEIAAQLSAAQAGGNQMAMQGQQTAGLASQQALAALNASGQLGGQMQAQQFSQAAQQAAAQNAINQFNTANQQAVAGQNTAAQNQAQYYNLSTQQNLANANVAQQNAEAQRELQAQQTEYQDTLQQAQAAASVALGAAPQYNAGANATSQSWNNIGTGVAGAVNALNNQGIASNAQPTVNVYGGSGSSAPSTLNTSGLNLSSSYSPYSNSSSSPNYNLMWKGGKIAGYHNGGTIEGEKASNYTKLKPYDMSQIPGGKIDGGKIPQDYSKMNLGSSIGGSYKTKKEKKADMKLGKSKIQNFAIGGQVQAVIKPDLTPVQITDELKAENNDHVGGTIRDGSKDEIFVVGTMVFNVETAKKISQGQTNGKAVCSNDWSEKINVEQDHALKADSENPVLIAQIPMENGLIPLLFDGHHRMYRAISEGKQDIDAYLFSPEESLVILSAPPDLMYKLRANLKAHVDNSQHMDDGGEVKDNSQQSLQSNANSAPQNSIPMPNGMSSGGNVLTANARKHIAPKNFALPGGRYPINDATHARNALARVSQHGTPEEKAKVRAKVHSKYPGIHMQKKNEGGPVMDTNQIMDYFKGGNILDANARKHIAAKNFALPNKRYPINDEAHARNALARISQYGNPSEKAEVRAKVHAKYPGMEIAHLAHGGPIETCGMCSGGMASYWKGGEANDNRSSAIDSDSGNTYAKGGKIEEAKMEVLSKMLMDYGGKVPGKSKVKGDSPKNDTVPVMLSPGEVVIPRSISHDAEAIKKFLAKQKK